MHPQGGCGGGSDGAEQPRELVRRVPHVPTREWRGVAWHAAARAVRSACMCSEYVQYVGLCGESADESPRGPRARRGAAELGDSVEASAGSGRRCVLSFPPYTVALGLVTTGSRGGPLRRQ